MFEDRCFVCGHHLADEGYVSLHRPCSPHYSLLSRRAYCSDDCENSDLYSPSISSSSSALSSPQLGCVAGAEVPPLVPSALGSALRSFTDKTPYYVSSSSSASSTSWSVLTDEEDQEVPNPFTTDHNDHDAFEDVDPNLKVQNFINSVNNFALSYTRRPSGTNNHSMVPQGKGPSSRLVLPGGAPMHLPDDLSSELGLSSADTLESDYEAAGYPDHSTTAKTKRTRNRASLPACFSLLQMGSSAKPLRSSPISGSSGYTLRQSPPTPKIAYKNPASNMQSTSTVVPLSGLHATPRGRRREAGQSSCSRRSGHSSPSRSRSRRSRVQATDTSDINCQAIRIQESCEPGSDRFADVGLLCRGRRTIRRNSSPSSRMTRDLEPAFNAGISQMGVAARHSGSGSRPHARGRMRVEELDGIGSTNTAPGYGTGRSGLVSRERGQQRRIFL